MHVEQQQLLPRLRRGRACGAAPDLPDVAVATVEPRQARLRADDAPVSVVEEAVRRDVTADVAAFIGALRIIRPFKPELRTCTRHIDKGSYNPFPCLFS